MTDTHNQLETLARDRLALVKQLRFCDAGIWLGPPQGFPLARPLTAARVGEVLRRYSLSGGLVSHWLGAAAAAQEGNRELAAAFAAGLGAGHELHAVWTALPLYPRDSGPLPVPEALPPEVQAVRIFPVRHHFPLASWCLGGLCAWLEQRRLPLFIWHTELDWTALHGLAGEFPRLRIIVETQTQKILYHTRPLFALMRTCANVRLETSNFAGAGFLDHAVREFGPERLIFGSFLPVADPWVPIGMVLDADISAHAKALIAGENLRQLLREVES